MRLTVLERLVLLNILPKEGDFLTLKTIREVREAIAFDADAEEFGVTQESDGVHCANFGAEKDIDLPPRVLPVIVSVLTDLNNQRHLTEQHFSLYEKFIET
jgi:hypothetical protein